MPPPPAIPESGEDAERLALIAHVARHVQADAEGKSWAPMTGGSALRLQYGLPRPSFDLDLDVSSPDLDWLAAVRRAVRQSPWGGKAEVAHKQAGRGAIRIIVRGTGAAWQTKVDIKPEPELTETDCLRSRDGLATRTLRHIAKVKRQKLIDWDTGRDQGRDLYDYAWLLACRPESVPVKDRRLFLDWMLSWGKSDAERWRTILQQDRAIRGIDPDAVVEAALSTLDADPGLRFADAKSAGATPDARWTGDGLVALGCRLPGGAFAPIQFHPNPAAAATFAEAHEIMQADAVLAALRETPSKPTGKLPHGPS